MTPPSTPPDIDDILQGLGERAAAGEIVAVERALEPLAREHPEHAEVHRLRGLCLLHLNRMDEGIVSLTRAAELRPDSAELWATLGNALGAARRNAEAIAAMRRSVELDPSLVEAWNLVGTLAYQEGDLVQAERAFDRATELGTTNPGAITNAAIVLSMTGRHEESVRRLRDAARANPDHLGLWSNLCNALNFIDADPADVLAAHTHLGRLLMSLEGGLPVPTSWPNSRDPGRRLRVGILSAELIDHSVAYFLMPILRSRDPASVEYIAYSTIEETDAMTQRIGPMFDGWRDVSRLVNNPLVQQIRDDQVDILVELSGHTSGNRLRALRMRAAPVQVTYCGYPNTTGLPTIDYRLVDSITDPSPEADALATERLVRLDPCFLCFMPWDAPVAPPPSTLAGGPVTFGSFNMVRKVSAGTIDAWSRILGAVPGSRLVLKSSGLEVSAARDALLGAFAARGIEASRVELLPRVAGKLEHLALYGRMDIALDPFPYHGTTTTCEALWMGVPVVSLRGRVHAARVGTSLLAATGVPELVASSVDEYIEIATRLAGDPARLDDYRRTLRARMQASPLYDGAGFARRFEAALRQMWTAWCAG